MDIPSLIAKPMLLETYCGDAVFAIKLLPVLPVSHKHKCHTSCPDRTQIKTAREYQPCKDRRRFRSILLEGSQAARNLPRDSTPRLQWYDTVQ